MRQLQALLVLLMVPFLTTATRQPTRGAPYWEAMELYVAHEEWMEALLDRVDYAQENKPWVDGLGSKQRDSLRLCRLAELSVSLEREKQSIFAEQFIYVYENRVSRAQSSFIGAALRLLVKDEMKMVCDDGMTTERVAQQAVQIYELYQPDLLYLGSNEAGIEKLRGLAQNETTP